MELKTAAWGGMLIGTTIGSFIPSLWGASMFSLSGVFLSAIGGIVGIAMGYKLAQG